MPTMPEGMPMRRRQEAARRRVVRPSIILRHPSSFRRVSRRMLMGGGVFPNAGPLICYLYLKFSHARFSIRHRAGGREGR